MKKKPKKQTRLRPANPLYHLKTPLRVPLRYYRRIQDLLYNNQYIIKQKATETKSEAAAPAAQSDKKAESPKPAKSTAAAPAPPPVETKSKAGSSKKAAEPPKKEEPKPPASKTAEKPEQVAIPSGKSTVSGKVLDGWL